MSLQDKIAEAQSILIKAKASTEGKALILFSGGKDSIVAAHLAKKTLGVTDAFSEVSLLAPQIKKEIQVIGSKMGLNVERHNQLPVDEFMTHWFNHIPPKKWKPSDLDSVRHWKSIPKHAKNNGYRLMIFGRRLEENTIPKPFYYKKSLGIHQVHPIYNWKRDEVFEYLHAENLEYPSCYRDGSKHLFSIVSMGQIAYKETNSLDAVFDVWRKYGIEYLNAAAMVDKRVRNYMDKNGY